MGNMYGEMGSRRMGSMYREVQWAAVWALCMRSCGGSGRMGSIYGEVGNSF